MRRRAALVLAFVLALLAAPWPAHAGPRFRVAFINIGEPAPFWDVYTAVIAAAANDLDIDLEILNARGDHLRMIEFAREIAARPVRPDYFLINNEKGTAGRMLEAAAAVGLKTLVIMSTFDPSEVQRYGRPREKYANFLGTLRPDNERAGFELACLLIEAARDHFPAPVRLLAISGAKATQAATDRNRGLEQALTLAPTDVALAQLVHSEWRRDKASRQIAGLLRRWPDTRVIWAANDPMALGAMDAAVAKGLKPGQDVFIGGVNLSVEVLRRVRAGEMVASVGGHFLGGAWALVMLRDYHDGIDFASEGLEQVFPMGAIERTNVDAYLEHFGDQCWDKIDFTRFSKSMNPKLKHYEFTLDKVLDQFRRTSPPQRRSAGQ
ncbi:MAG TPA: ABC transporter substrate-binding protein [Polyangia bacterium]|jgi:ABC-type sugar transport system substrate-binding protein|nr:ABC transporter substrate-binding protein [Polyangia bacterium]